MPRTPLAASTPAPRPGGSLSSHQPPDPPESSGGQATLGKPGRQYLKPSSTTKYCKTKSTVPLLDQFLELQHTPKLLYRMLCFDKKQATIPPDSEAVIQLGPVGGQVAPGGLGGSAVPFPKGGLPLPLSSVLQR